MGEAVSITSCSLSAYRSCFGVDDYYVLLGGFGRGGGFRGGRGGFDRDRGRSSFGDRDDFRGRGRGDFDNDRFGSRDDAGGAGFKRKEYDNRDRDTGLSDLITLGLWHCDRPYGCCCRVLGPRNRDF